MQPKKVVSLEEQDFTESEKIEEIFVDLAKNTKDKEYWKLKTGILSTKIQLSTDSSSEKAEEGERKLTYYTDKLSSSLKFKNFQNEDDWEFLHSPGKYRYTLVGGSSYNNESVYIIDFEAKSGGLYSGRAYISSESYALVRTDYKYALGKLGTDFHLLGVGYSKNGFKASISFEKIGMSFQMIHFIGAAEVLAVFGLFIERYRIWAAAVLALISFGAIIVHVLQDDLVEMGSPLVLGALSGALDYFISSAPNAEDEKEA